LKHTFCMTAIALLLGSSAAFGSATNKREEGALSSSRIQKDPTITDAWARATVPGQSVGAAYMKIFSPTNAVLVEAETMMAQTVEVHVMDHQKGVMRMRANGPVEIAGGTMAELVPGGKHLMLLGLSKPLKAGETFPMKLTFAGTGGESTVIVEIPIRVNGQ
jgi:periplasmic copper chaperone A